MRFGRDKMLTTQPGNQIFAMPDICQTRILLRTDDVSLTRSEGKVMFYLGKFSCVEGVPTAVGVTLTRPAGGDMHQFRWLCCLETIPTAVGQSNGEKRRYVVLRCTVNCFGTGHRSYEAVLFEDFPETVGRSKRDKRSHVALDVYEICIVKAQIWTSNVWYTLKPA